MTPNSTPSKALVRKLLMRNGYLEKFEDLMRNYPLLVARPYLKNRTLGRELLEKHNKPEKMLAAFHAIWVQHFTADEILDLIAFYKSDLGKKLVERDEQIRRKMQKAAIDLAVSIAALMILDDDDEPPANPPVPEVFD